MDDKEMEFKLTTAVEDAERFIMKAHAAIHKIRSDRYAKYGSKETAAAKRASMDLTRALADLRRR